MIEQHRRLDPRQPRRPGPDRQPPLGRLALLLLLLIATGAAAGCDRGGASGGDEPGDGAAATTGALSATTAAAGEDSEGKEGAAQEQQEGAEGGLGPGSAEQQVALAQAKVHFLNNDLEKAEEAFLKVMSIGEFSGAQVSALIALGQIYLERGEREQALAIYDKLLQGAPDLAEVQLVAGRALARAGEEQRAVRALQRALEVQPEFIFVHKDLGELYAGLGREEDAAKAFLDYERAVYKRAAMLEKPEETALEDRLKILEVFSMMSDDRAQKAVIEALTDPAPEVRELAAVTAGELQIGAAAPALRALQMADPDARARMAARGALEALGELPEEAREAPAGPTRVEEKGALPQ